MSLITSELQVARNLEVLEQVFRKHEIFLEQLSSIVGSYIEASDIAKPLIEAAGAEIEARGRASKRTIYGRTLSGRKRRSGGIIYYLGEKNLMLYNLRRLINIEKAESTKEVKVLYDTLRVVNSEEQTEKSEEQKLSKKTEKHLKKVENLTKKCDKILEKEVSRDKKSMKLLPKEVKNINVALMFSIREGAYARRLSRIIGASRALRILDTLFKKEEHHFSLFIKEEFKYVDDVSKNLKDIFKLIKENEKIEKQIHGKLGTLKKEGAKAKKEEKVSSRIKKMMKSLKKMQKHIAKIRKGAARYGAKIEGSIELLNAREKRLLKEETEEEKELGDVDRLVESMNRFSLMISRFENTISVSEVRLEPSIKWINTALISAYKLHKKNPLGATSFLGKVGVFAERAIIPALERIDEERKELYKEFSGDEGIVKNLGKDMEIMSQLEDKGFIKGLKDIKRSLTEFKKGVTAGNKKAIADLKKDIAELKRSRKEEEIIAKEEARAGAPRSAVSTRDIGAQIAQMKEKIKWLKSEFKAMKNEFNPAVTNFKKAIDEAPHFNLSGEGIQKLFKHGEIYEIIKNVGEIEQYTHSEEGYDSDEIGALKSWINDIRDVYHYVAFVKAARKSFESESNALKKMFLYYKSIAGLEKKFSGEMREAEESMNNLDVAIRELEEIMSKHAELFGEEARQLFAELRSVYNDANILVSELKKTENAISVFAHNLPQMKSAAKNSKEHLKDIEKLLKESEKNAEKFSKVFNKGSNEKL